MGNLPTPASDVQAWSAVASDPGPATLPAAGRCGAGLTHQLTLLLGSRRGSLMEERIKAFLTPI